MAHVTFVHGIGNKPVADTLHEVWLAALADGDGVDLPTNGITSTMVHWADCLYREPMALASGYEGFEDLEAGSQARSVEDIDMGWMTTADPQEAAFIEGVADSIGLAEVSGDGLPSVDDTLERVPLPWPVKRRLMKVLLRDVHHYLFNSEHSPRPGVSFLIQDTIRERMLSALEEGAAKPGPHVVVAHSMGTVIAYDCLKRVGDCTSVDALVTLGSPLGIDEIQDRLRPEWTRDDGFPGACVRRRWVNVYDRLDPVAGFDPKLANDYRRAGELTVEDIHESHRGRWRHGIDKYLAGARLRSAITTLLDL